jgi:hypothetical protein
MKTGSHFGKPCSLYAINDNSKISILIVAKTFYSFRLFLLTTCNLCFWIFSFIGCLDMAGDCETEVSRRIFNPGKSLQAISIITDCGATTSPSYGIRIVESSDTTDDGIRGNTILGSNTGVGIKWVSNDTLLITGADTTSGYTMKTYLKLRKTATQIIILYND